MNWISICALAFACFISQAAAAKILFFYAHNGISHLGSLTPFIKTMTRNHEVTVLQTGDQYVKPRAIDNATVVLWTLQDGVDFRPNLNRIMWYSHDHANKLASFTNMQEAVLADFIQKIPNQVRELLNERWDLVVVDGLFTNHGFTFASFLKRTRNTPYIVFATTFTLPSFAWTLGLGGSWVAQPPLLSFLPRDSEDIFHSSSLWNRLDAAGQAFLELFMGEFVDYKNSVKFGMEKITTSTVFHESAMVLSDQIYGFGHTTIESNRLQSVGHHCDRSAKLPQEFKDFVEDQNSKGTIYVAFGTMVKFDFAPEFVLDAFFDALNELTDYRIVFTFRGTTPRDIGKHVKLVEWAPQPALLSHPKTKLFLSHGGLKSFKEGLCSDTPMIILPFFAEQGRNAKAAAKLGLAGILNKFTVTKQKMVGEMRKILEDEDYARNMKKFHTMYSDQPVSHLEKKKFHAERILRKNGEKISHKSQAETITTFEAFSIDLVLILIIFALICTKN